ncbi:MAG: DNA adenine methylase, partial [bacterium]
RYDRPHTLFYLDPPYFNSETDYGKNIFSKEDFFQMSEILRNIEGKFLLSINDTPEIREIFSGFEFHEVKVRYSIGKQSKKNPELIITNQLDLSLK